MAVNALGGVCFLPFLVAGGGQSRSTLTAFVGGVFVVSTLAAWLGLRYADATGLPMPYLRRLDSPRRDAVRPTAVRVMSALGVGAGVLGIVGLRVANVAPLPGGIVTRALSTVFAAGPLEIVLHLGLMSFVVWLARGRKWVGIVTAALALVAFHLSGGGAGEPPLVLATSVVLNGGIGLALGWLYAEYGFEFAMGGHAIAHFITLVFG